ncbi:MAG: hypothetical protein ACFFAO_04760 [Candidatus Hermodarchaeota archaeon]
MITDYAIILENNILYCSNEKKYTTFEIVLFIEKLIHTLNPKQTWRLNNVLFQNFDKNEERIIIKHLITSDRQNLIFCILGKIQLKSQFIINMLEEFYEKVNEYYKSIEVLNNSSKKPIFKEIMNILTDFLTNKYNKILDLEEINNDYVKNIENKILYCGISSQGLPIISHLYDTSLLDNLSKQINEENIELFSSNLSAQLATIEMNSKIRANISIKEIHIDDFGSRNPNKIFVFTDIFGYSLDFLTTGDYNKTKQIIRRLEQKISKEKVLQIEFSGDLKPYKHLQNYFDEVINDFKSN